MRGGQPARVSQGTNKFSFGANEPLQRQSWLQSSRASQLRVRSLHRYGAEGDLPTPPIPETEGALFKPSLESRLCRMTLVLSSSCLRLGASAVVTLQRYTQVCLSSKVRRCGRGVESLLRHRGAKSDLRLPSTGRSGRGRRRRSTWGLRHPQRVDLGDSLGESIVAIRG